MRESSFIGRVYNFYKPEFFVTDQNMYQNEGNKLFEKIHVYNLIKSPFFYTFTFCLQTEHPDVIGDIRGQGLLWTIDIIKDRFRRLPSPRIATNLMIMLKDDKILIGTTGEFRNILLFSPPLCFTVENCTT